jgi:hypothetical protein
MKKIIIIILFLAFFAFGRNRDGISVLCDTAYVSISNAKCKKNKFADIYSGNTDDIVSGVYSGSSDDSISDLEAKSVFGEVECTRIKFHGIYSEFIPGKKTKEFAEKNKLKYDDNYIRDSWNIKIKVEENVIWHGKGRGGFYIVFDCEKGTNCYENLAAFPPKSEIDAIANIEKNENDVKLHHFFADIEASYEYTFENQKTKKISKNFILEFKDGVVQTCKLFR